VLAKLRAADSRPGVLDLIGDTEYFLFGGYEEDELRGDPGAIVARRDGAICRATADGAVWIRSCAAARRSAVRRPSSCRPRWRSATPHPPCRRPPRR
jgi:putative two-component system protein, hydrogenase maturation factor HypX/HoxX